ncbi:MAG TPA: phage tail tip lysozyme [Streptosporangiaceae bacterium]|nr:phage tail tip lysozyme [Streptosporangiaceae bacterium]
MPSVVFPMMASSDELTIAASRSAGASGCFPGGPCGPGFPGCPRWPGRAGRPGWPGPPGCSIDLFGVKSEVHGRAFAYFAFGPYAAGDLSCSASASGPLPANYAAIMSFLTSHGYTGNAAAGMAGNIYQESGGNPESEGDGGGGLIGWTPLPGGYVTGNPAADLRTQLTAILAFNKIWSQYIPALNAACSPAAAAGIYVTDFERAGVPAAGTREAAAEAVAAACGI